MLKATLVIATLDRLARSVSFIANLMDTGVAFVACDMLAANRLALHITAAVGEAEARMISERTVAALATAKARGVRVGNPTNLPDAQAAGHRTMVQDADDHAAMPPSTPSYRRLAELSACSSRGRLCAKHSQ